MITGHNAPGAVIYIVSGVGENIVRAVLVYSVEDEVLDRLTEGHNG